MAVDPKVMGLKEGKGIPTPLDLADLMRDFTQTAQEWTRTYARMQGELARLSEELREKNALLKSQERLAALGQMAAGVAHEIRNPLGGIQLCANLLQRALVGRPGDLSLVEKILAGVKHMERVVQQTLTFAGGMTPDRRECELGALIKSSLALLGLDDEPASGIKVRVRPSEGFSLTADPDLLIQMFSNLIANAREAMGGAGEISIDAAREPGRVVISVADTGPGVPEDLRAKIFDPFVTSKANGVGLGLSIVWRIVEAHEGELRLDGDSRRGACFVIALPEAATPRDAAEVSA